MCSLNHLFKNFSSCSVNPSHKLSQPLSWMYCSTSALKPPPSSAGPNSTPRFSVKAPHEVAMVTKPVIVPKPVPVKATPTPIPIELVITPPMAQVLRTQLLSFHAREAWAGSSNSAAVHTASPSIKSVAPKVVSVWLSIRMTASSKASDFGKPVSSNSP